MNSRQYHKFLLFQNQIQIFSGALHRYPSPNVLYACQNSTPSVFNFLLVLLFKNSPTTRLVAWKAFYLCFSIIQLEYFSSLPQTIFQTLDVKQFFILIITLLIAIVTVKAVFLCIIDKPHFSWMFTTVFLENLNHVFYILDTFSQ